METITNPQIAAVIVALVPFFSAAGKYIVGTDIAVKVLDFFGLAERDANKMVPHLMGAALSFAAYLGGYEIANDPWATVAWGAVIGSVGRGGRDFLKSVFSIFIKAVIGIRNRG